MSDGDRSELPHTRAGSVVAAVTVALAGVGLLAWIWIGDWRIGASAGVAIAILCFVGGAVDSSAKRRSRALGYCATCKRDLPVPPP